MNVSQENTSKVAAVVKVGIVKADYEEKVEKAISPVSARVWLRWV